MRKALVRVILLFAVSFMLMRCDRPPDTSLIVGGVWKTDSLYSYYNGFGSTRYDFEEEPHRSYSSDGVLTMTRGPETRSFRYEIKSNDTLLHYMNDGRVVDRFRVLKISKTGMVLRKELPPVFPGEGQMRYQVIYISKEN
jgi:hypothetical protein